ncbi:MAG TPA: hypothetical protein VGS79_03320 [Puia sp.]|nr:hypothetical protein [Puia sp.]
MNWQKGIYRLPVLRGMFLIAGLLLLFSVFHTARHGANTGVTRKAFVALGSHRALPMSTADKRCDVDGSFVIVSSNWSVARAISEVRQHFPALPEELSFLHLSSLSLRGPPPF